jgi:hypothetical protein
MARTLIQSHFRHAIMNPLISSFYTLFSVAVFILVGVVPLRAAETPAKLPVGESLGAGLLEDLGPDLFAIPPRDQNDPAITEPVPTKRPSSADKGEDVGQANSPLHRVRDGMCRAQELLAEHDTTEPAVPVQVQVIADLDALIAQLKKQSQSSQKSGSNKQAGSRRSQERAPRPGRPAGTKKSSAGKGEAAAQDSTARGDGGQAESADTPDWQQLLKDLWGHLPERVREQLIQAPTDEFLPKYKLEIEKYFRRLAEDGQDDNVR